MILLNEVTEVEHFAHIGFGAIDNLFDIENAFTSSEKYLDIVGDEHNRCLLFATEIFNKAIEMEENIYRVFDENKKD